MKKEDQSPSKNDLDLVDAMGGANEVETVHAAGEETDPDDVQTENLEPETGNEPMASVDVDDVDDVDDVVDPDKGVDFSAPIEVAGEQFIPLSQLKEWKHHPAVGSRTRGANAAGLIASAIEPANIAPIVVLPAVDGFYPIQDGRLRWHAFQEAHGEDSDIEVRCVMFVGTEAEAVQAACDDALGSTPRSAIEIARSILNVQRVAGISQKAIAERFPVLKKDQVSRMTIAAKMVERYPMVFALLEEPDRVSIDLGVKFAQFMKSAAAEDRESVMEQAEILASEGASLKRNEFLEALGIELGDGKQASNKPDPLEPVESIPVIGHDDQPVGALEMLSDDVTRLRLPDPTEMTFAQREEAAEAFIKQIRIYFDLDVAE